MSFMQPQIEAATADHVLPDDDDYIITDRQGTRVTQNGRLVIECTGDDEASMRIREHMDAEQFWPNVFFQNDHGETQLRAVDEHGNWCDPVVTGYAWRLSAPGYLDCTDWSLADSIVQAIEDCIGMHGDTFDRDDWNSITSHLGNWGEFWNGYLVALVFTGSKDGTNGEPIVHHPGQDICEILDGDEVGEWLTDDQYSELISNAIDFYCAALKHLGSDDSTNYGRLGSDFHLTRNGHGAGFWDGDWPDDLGRVLTDLSKPYSTCEIQQVGETPEGNPIVEIYN